ncbi:MAG: hypothetical protein J6T57_03395 [Alphaproteobacteria bacterium]|nr:hypothetical protein [Alphaproteobacteria bacterium]
MGCHGITAPAPLPVMANLPANVQGNGFCRKQINGGSSQGACSDTLFNSMERGDWGVTFGYKTGITYPGGNCTGTWCHKEVRGICACISESASTLYAHAPESLWSTLDTSYNNHKNGEPLPNNARFCYCKMTNPIVSGTNGIASSWIFLQAQNSSEACSEVCATYCSIFTQRYPNVRATLFGAY